LFAVASGTINYRVRAGDAVKKGDVLATLDSPALQNNYERERASLSGIDAALLRQEIEMRREMLKSRQDADVANIVIHAAERELKRARWAWEQQAVSEREIRKAEDDVATAKLNYDHARSTAALESESLALELRTKKAERDRQSFIVENLKSQVEELTVRSPVAGIVANLAQAQRAKIIESAPLLTVVDLSEFEIEVQISESYARDIKPTMNAEVTLDGQTYAGVVAAISPEVRQNQVTGRVKFASSQPKALRQNQRASVRIVLDERTNVLKFERGSLIDTHTTFVYALRHSRAVRLPVQLGSSSMTDVEVLDGLNSGDQIVISDTRDFASAPELVIAN
jgi:HlyD family secretion protein